MGFIETIQHTIGKQLNTSWSNSAFQQDCKFVGVILSRWPCHAGRQDKRDDHGASNCDWPYASDWMLRHGIPPLLTLELSGPQAARAVAPLERFVRAYFVQRHVCMDRNLLKTQDVFH